MINDHEAISYRTAASICKPIFVSIGRPFSLYDFAERYGFTEDSVRRCCSLARAKGCKTLVMEKIPICGLLKDENDELSRMGYWSDSCVYRLSFFSCRVWHRLWLDCCADSRLEGYVILKHDGKSSSKARWYVFESVFRKYQHNHNCIAAQRNYVVRCGSRHFNIAGVLYCQQNGLNKSCAHVALQSVLSKAGHDDVRYSEMNRIAAGSVAKGAYIPSDGLLSNQVADILKAYDVPFKALDYDAEREKRGSDMMREIAPYQKIVYDGVESGGSALIGFQTSNPILKNGSHMIPFFGHTFNKDTWVTDAENSYFDISKGCGYIPSDNWTSSFIGHDDNFGQNFCVPRLYLKPEQVQFAVEILPAGASYTGLEAEYASYPLLQQFVPYLGSENHWLKRLEKEFSSARPNVVLRAVSVLPKDYFTALRQIRDWNDWREREEYLLRFEKIKWPQRFWVVELSLPQLYSANERKLGELVFDATVSPDITLQIAAAPSFMFARFPERYIVSDQTNGNGANLTFKIYPSQLGSHVPVFRLGEG